RSAAARGLPVVAVHSALAACVMAAVSGELGEGPGAAAVESAPAALAGLAHARLDRAPMILLTEPAGSPSVQGDALAKQSLRVAADSASRGVARAAELAMAEPRGPVHLALPRAAAERLAVPGPAAVGRRPPSAPDGAALGFGGGLEAVGLGGAPGPDGATVLHLGRARHTGQGYVAAVEVVGAPGLVLEELAPRLRGRARADWDVAEVDRARRVRAARLAAGAAGLGPNRMAQLARELTPAGTIAAVEGCPAMLGAALGWLAVAPGECLVPNALGTAGFALPAAIAAQLAHPGRRVLCFTDPGGLLRVLGEPATARRPAPPRRRP